MQSENQDIKQNQNQIVERQSEIIPKQEQQKQFRKQKQLELSKFQLKKQKIQRKQAEKNQIKQRPNILISKEDLQKLKADIQQTLNDAHKLTRDQIQFQRPIDPNSHQLSQIISTQFNQQKNALILNDQQESISKEENFFNKNKQTSQNSNKDQINSQYQQNIRNLNDKIINYNQQQFHLKQDQIPSKYHPNSIDKRNNSKIINNKQQSVQKDYQQRFVSLSSSAGQNICTATRNVIHYLFRPTQTYMFNHNNQMRYSWLPSVFIGSFLSFWQIIRYFLNPNSIAMNLTGTAIQSFIARQLHQNITPSLFVLLIISFLIVYFRNRS